jgi:hypothetical protein
VRLGFNYPCQIFYNHMLDALLCVSTVNFCVLKRPTTKVQTFRDKGFFLVFFSLRLYFATFIVETHSSAPRFQLSMPIFYNHILDALLCVSTVNFCVLKLPITKVQTFRDKGFFSLRLYLQRLS